MKKKDDIDIKIINEIKDSFNEINSKLDQKEEISDIDNTKYILINKVWLQKYLTIVKKENIFKDLIYHMLKKISLNPPRYIYTYNNNNYQYLYNFNIIPKNIFPYLLSLSNNDKNNPINNNNNESKIYQSPKIILKSSKIILILEDQLSLEILNKNIIPEYLLSFNHNENITIEQMLNIYIEDMKIEIPENAKRNIIYEYKLNNGIKLTTINLGKILEEEKLEKNKLSKDNYNKMNQLWENKYKIKIDKRLDEITNKYNNDLQKQINLNNKMFKLQIDQQNKIFKDNFNNAINQLNDSKILGEKDKNDNKKNNINDNKISLILDNKDNNNNNNQIESIENNKKIDKDIDDFLIVDNAKEIEYTIPMSKKPLNKESLDPMIISLLFFLSNINSLTEYFIENKESIDLYKFVESNTLSEIFFDFLMKIKDIQEEMNESQKEVYKEYSNKLINAIFIKIKNRLYKLNSPGDILNFILSNLNSEQNSSYKLINEQSSICLMNNEKKVYDIYNEQDMLQMFIDKNSLVQKNLIYSQFYNIIKSTKLCKKCNRRSYEFDTIPTLKIYLNKSNSLVNENHSDFEMYNTLMCKICFPDNIAQLLSPSYLSKKVEFCKNCDKSQEIIYNKYIYALKEYLIIDVDRENDPKNDMIFIYPEKLDLKNQSQLILNLYQLTGVICKKINEYNYNINDVDNDISHYICYFKNKKENKWIYFDENYNVNELENKNEIFNFKGVSVLLYSKIEDESN